MDASGRRLSMPLTTGNRFAVLQDLGDDEAVLKDPGVGQVDYTSAAHKEKRKESKKESQAAWWKKLKADKSDRAEKLREDKKARDRETSRKARERNRLELEELRKATLLSGNPTVIHIHHHLHTLQTTVPAQPQPPPQLQPQPQPQESHPPNYVSQGSQLQPQPQPQESHPPNYVSQGSQVKQVDIFFVIAACGWPTGEARVNKTTLGHLRRGETTAFNLLDMAGWAEANFPVDGTPRTFNALRVLYETHPFSGPFRSQCTRGPLRIYEFSYPEYDSGYPCPAHVRKCLDDCRAALARNPSLQLVVIGYRCYPCTCAPSHSPLTCVSCTQIGCPAIKISILAERVRQGWAIDRMGGCVQKRREEGQAAGYYVAPDKFRPRRHRGVYPCRPRWRRA